jgi:hypothetical protein
VVALAWPGITAYALTIWIGAWAVTTGGWEIAMVFGSGEAAGQRARFALSGLLSVALGVVLFARPDIGAVSLAEVFGFFSFAAGLSCLVMAGAAQEQKSKARCGQPPDQSWQWTIGRSHRCGMETAGSVGPPELGLDGVDINLRTRPQEV